jgi:hypothetical protein
MAQAYGGSVYHISYQRTTKSTIIRLANGTYVSSVGMLKAYTPLGIM